MRVDLAPGYSISRIIKGGWQLAVGHRAASDHAQDRVPVHENGDANDHAHAQGARPLPAHADMAAFVDAGITTFDCADIYTGVEELIGAFEPPSGRAVQVHTKYVPDLGSLATVDLTGARAIIDRSRRRLRREAIDLVQFHWWDYGVDRFVEVALDLDRLRREGAIRRIGVTNFDTPRLRRLLDAGVPVISHQVQYSLLDRRPAGAMAALCADRGIQFLCYGALLGGFLSERWLGAPEPVEPLENRSLTKYKLVIDDTVGWSGFQFLLHSVQAIARKHDVSVGAIGIAWVLAQPLVAAAIVGARNTRHLPETVSALGVRLDDDDLDVLNALSGRGLGGDVYELERDREGPHGRIMRYNLNQG